MTTPPAWNPLIAFKTCMKRYIKFSGRASRAEYWFWYLSLMLIAFAVMLLALILTGIDPSLSLLCILLYWLTTLTFLLPGISVFVRRMHDIGRSGWAWLWCLIPFVGAIIVLVFLVSPSGPANQYGNGPDGPLV